MHILSYLFRFHPRNEGTSCLKGACGCVNSNIYKKCQNNYFLRSKDLKSPNLILLRGGCWRVDPSPHFLGVGHGKGKPN